MDSYPEDEYGPAPTRSSIAAPLIRALLFAALAFLIYWIVVGSAGDGGDDIALQDDTDTAAPQTTTPLVVGSEPPLETMPTGPPSASPTPTDGLVGGPAASESSAAPSGQVGAGTSVQVIAGANTTAEQKADAIQALQDMGYDVTDGGLSPNPYPQTTVFATAGEEAAAQALVEADDRFTTVEENPGTLTDQIQVHVLVGEDWPT